MTPSLEALICAFGLLFFTFGFCELVEAIGNKVTRK